MSLFNDASIIITPNAFKAGKLYAVKGADLTVTRATSATRVNANGIIETVGANVSRVDYSGGGCPSILVEPQRTNLSLQSEDFSNAVYIKVGSTISTNVAVAPDGTTTADKLVENTSTGLHSCVIIATQSTSGDYTYSVFVKPDGRTKIRLTESFSIGGNIQFDLTTGTFTTTAPAKNGKIEAYANGWYKCSATWTFTGGATTQIFLDLVNSSNTSNYTGNGTSGVCVWGSQLEPGSNSTSYIKTTTATVTRNADVITLTPTTGLTEITETFSDDTTNVITTIPSTYTMSQGRIKNVVMK
jgi:hypothetical protein